MKILYVAPYRDGTGYSEAAIGYILSLDSVGVDVVPRTIKLNDYSGPLPKRILELEQKSSQGCDICIQHTLPYQYSYNGNLINIGLYASETSHFKNSVWPDRLNMMDGNIVINNQMIKSARKSGVKTRIDVVPHAVDVEKFERSYKHFEPLMEYKDRGDFIFYFIGEFCERKNIAALLKAFYTTFHPDENVQLVIKTNKPGISPQQLAQETQKFAEEIKRGLKLYNGKTNMYKKVLFITERLSEEDLLSLHNTCDSFVCASRGEAWCLPAMDAMGFGKTPIVPFSTGFLDYIDESTGWMVATHDDFVNGVYNTFEDLYVGNEFWYEPNASYLRSSMRECYENNNLRNQKAQAGLARIYNFSYQIVGQTLKQILESYIHEPSQKAADG